jgi:hypothetical protein
MCVIVVTKLLAEEIEKIKRKKLKRKRQWVGRNEEIEIWLKNMQNLYPN